MKPKTKGRPSEGLTERTMVRMTPKQRARWAKCAAHFPAMSESDFIRFACDRLCNEHGVKP